MTTKCVPDERNHHPSAHPLLLGVGQRRIARGSISCRDVRTWVYPLSDELDDLVHIHCRPRARGINRLQAGRGRLLRVTTGGHGWKRAVSGSS